MTIAPQARDGAPPANRFLLTCAFTRYRGNPGWDRPELRENVARMVELFCGDFLPTGSRYEHRDVLGDSPRESELLERLRAFAMHPERTTDDYVVLYLTGHGEILDDGDHVLLTYDSDPSDLISHTLSTARIVQHVLAGTNVRRLLLLLDTCYAGSGGADLVRESLRRLAPVPDRRAEPDRSGGIVVIAATHPFQTALPEVFTSAFVDAAHSIATAGNAPRLLRIGAVVAAANYDPAKPATQAAVWHQVGMDGDEPDFLHNPRYRSPLVSVDLLEQERAFHAEQQETHLRDRFVPATRWFTGRRRVLDELVDWLCRGDGDGRPRVVTGNAGSGKTAVLGLLATVADPDRRPGIARDHLPPGAERLDGTFARTVYAGSMSTAQVRDRIASTVTTRVDSTQDLIDALNSRTGPPLTVLVDALDEARDPEELCRSVLVPLTTRCATSLRLLLGCRPHLLTSRLLGAPDGGRLAVLDLDSSAYADPESIRAYVQRILVSVDTLDSFYHPSGIYHDAAEEYIQEVATAIAEAAGDSFLVARITATTETTAAELPNPSDAGWRAALPRRAGEAMRRDLELRLGDQSGRASRLLLPLAYAQASGLPWEDVWPRLAEALSPGHGLGNDDLVWLRRAAGSYAVEHVADNRSVYRLYHQALVEHLRDGRDHETDQRAIAAALVDCVPFRGQGLRDWSVAHPYVLAHLASHAAAGGVLDELVRDPVYLLAADRPALLAGLGSVRDETARRNAETYRAALPRLRGRPRREHAAYLRMAALCADAPELTAALRTVPSEAGWSPAWARWTNTTPHHTLVAGTGGVWSVVTTEVDGRPLAVAASGDGRIRCWDLLTATVTGAVLAGHTDWVSSLSVLEHEGRVLAVSGSFDRTLRVWNLSTGTAVGRPLRGHTAAVRSVGTAVLNGVPIAVSGSDDGTVRVWDLLGNRQLRQMHDAAPANGVVAVGGTEEDPAIVVAFRRTGAGAGVWRPRGGWQMKVLLGAGGGHPVTALAVGHTTAGDLVAVGDHEGTVTVSRTADGTRIDRKLRTGRPVRALTFVPGQDGTDGGRLVIGSDDGVVQVREPASGQVVAGPFSGHFGTVRAVALSEVEGRRVAVSGSDDGTVRVWDLSSEQTTDRPRKNSATASTLATGILDGEHVVALVRRYVVDLRLVRTGELVRRLRATWDELQERGPDGWTGPGGPDPRETGLAVDRVAIGETRDRTVLVVNGDAGLRAYDLHSMHKLWPSDKDAEEGRSGETFGAATLTVLPYETAAVRRADGGNSVRDPLLVAGSAYNVRIHYLASGRRLAPYATGDAVGRSVAAAGGPVPTVAYGTSRSGRIWLAPIASRRSVSRVAVPGLPWRSARGTHGRMIGAASATRIGGRALLASAARGVVLLHDLTTRSLVDRFDTGTASVSALCWLQDHLLVIATGRTVTIRDCGRPENRDARPGLTVELDASVQELAAAGPSLLVLTTNGVMCIDVQEGP